MENFLHTFWSHSIRWNITASSLFSKWKFYSLVSIYFSRRSGEFLSLNIFFSSIDIFLFFFFIECVLLFGIYSSFFCFNDSTFRIFSLYISCIIFIFSDDQLSIILLYFLSKILLYFLCKISLYFLY